MNKKVYRRQFLLSAIETSSLMNWQKTNIGAYHIYVHPDTFLHTIEDNSNDVKIALIGFIINPHAPNETNVDILNQFLENPSIESVFKKLYFYTGRFVLIIKNKSNYFVFNDPCGLRSVFYTKYHNQLYLASQPLLFKEVITLKEGERYHQYNTSKYKKIDIEHWIPSGCSLFENVDHLAPNHYLDFKTYSQIRYWPNKKLVSISIENAVKQAGEIIKNTMIAYNNRFKLALPLTGGVDSRTILSGCKEIAHEIFFYTLQYRSLNLDSNDIKIPRNLLSKLGYVHHIIDCRKTTDKEFAKIYTNNSDNSHLNDWGNIAFGMQDAIPDERIVIKGNCTEIGRCHYYSLGKHPKIKSVHQLLNLVPGWDKLDFVKNQLSRWLEKVEQLKLEFGYDILDLFYWEHRLGSWQAQSQLEWDIVQDAVTPYNNRELIDITLAVDKKYRCSPNYLFFSKIMDYNWQETLMEPINPKSLYKKLKIIYKVIKQKITLN